MHRLKRRKSFQALHVTRSLGVIGTERVGCLLSTPQEKFMDDRASQAVSEENVLLFLTAANVSAEMMFDYYFVVIFKEAVIINRPQQTPKNETIVT